MSARRKLQAASALLAAVALLFLSCSHRAGPPETLAGYGLFDGNARLQRPADGVVPYDVNTPLFSDHAVKLRFVKLPPGAAVDYRAEGVLDFPVGTLIAKTFAYPVDARVRDGQLQLLETRILEREPEGWVARPYIWNEEQTEARLEVTGGVRRVSWVDEQGDMRTHDYRVPNANQCKGCHRTTNQGRTMRPIGPTVAQLNRDFAYAEGIENQLAHWTKVGALVGAPTPEAAPRHPVWNDPATGTLDERARVWLDVNCAHCHNPDGPARTSNLDLRFAQTDPTLLGVYKSPVAAGRGSGDRLHDIVPGEPDRSILVYRLESVDPGIMMPELGRSVVDEEGVALVRRWIEEMPDPFGGAGVGPGER